MSTRSRHPPQATQCDTARSAITQRHLNVDLLKIQRFWRICRRDVGIEIETPPPDVMPLAMLVTNFGVHADGPESEFLVDSHARGVRQRDASMQHAIALLPQDLEKPCIELTANSLAAIRISEIDTDVRRPSIRVPAGVFAGVRVPDNSSGVILRNEPREPRQSTPNVIGGFGRIRGLRIERDGCLANVVRVDFADRQRVIGRCNSYSQGFTSQVEVNGNGQSAKISLPQSLATKRVRRGSDDICLESEEMP